MITIDANNRRIEHSDHDVYVNGALSHIVKCIGTSPGQASFEIPVERYDSKYKESLHQRHVAVTTGGQSIFFGFIDTSTARLNAEADGFVFSAKSAIEKLNNVWVGQKDNRNVVTFPATYNSLDGILNKLFLDLPNGLGGILWIGNTSVLTTKQYDFGEGIVFRNTTYSSAIDSIIAFAGDVAWAPRYTINGCYIDFYRVNHNTNGTSVATLGEYGKDSLYANIEEIEEDTTSTDTIDQVTVFGSPEKFVISLYSHPSVPANARLTPDWDASLEAQVLNYPDIAKPDSPLYVKGSEHVFHRYRVPGCLLPLTPLDKLPIPTQIMPSTEAGWIPQDKQTQYKLQAYIWSTTPSLGTTTALNYTDDAFPKIVEAEFDLANGYVYFKAPTIKNTAYEIVPIGSDLHPKTTSVLADVGVTLAYENPQHVLHYRTTTGKPYPNNKNILREDFTRVVITNIGKPFSGVTFPTTLLFYEDDPGGAVTSVSQVQVLRDDRPQIQMLAQEILKEHLNKNKTVRFTVPYISHYYRIGNRITFQGITDYVHDDMAITSVSHNLDGYRTTVEANNTKPLKFSETQI